MFSYLKKRSRMMRHLALVLSFCFGTTGIVHAQQLENAIEKYATIYSPERLYVHYDKAAYAPGETVWFKTYIMNEVIPAFESKTLYTDWIDDKGNLLLHAVSPIVEGVTNGQFDIPAEYKGRSISVRAYTKWMLNFDSAFLYQKDLPVITKDRTTPDSKTKPIPTLRFFPEGGDMIAGISSKIAFKANDQWGRPINVKGTIINSQGKIEDKFSSMHAGMGFISLMPKAGITYSAKWKDEKGVEHITELPKPKSDGAVLQVAISGANRLFNVVCSPEFAAKNDSVYLVGTLYQHPAFKVGKSTKGDGIKGTIPVSSLPSGILTITLFDQSMKPIAERITYINNHEYTFKPEFEVQRWGLNKRARNELKITIPDSLVSNLSISVTDALIPTDTSTNIIAHLMLSSELKGHVHNPAYYFSNSNDSTEQHLDLVMMTNGWRRFKWDEILTGKIPTPRLQKDTGYISLSGKVLGVLPQQINRDAAVVLMVKQKDKEGQMILVPIEPNGTFNDRSTILFDTAQVYYSFQKKDLKDASIQFMVDRLPAPTLNPSIYGKPFGVVSDTTGNARQWFLADEANSAAEMMKVKTLENVTIQSRGKSQMQVMDEKYTRGLFSGGDGYQFDLINDKFVSGAMNIFTYLQGKVPGLQITTNAANTSLQWRGGAPALYLDEVPTDASFLQSLNINDVAFVKVFRPPFMGGFNGANGAIAIYTRRGDDVKPEPGKGLANNKVFGYSPIKEFYSPNYASFTTKNDERDIRTTLYWNPSIVTSPQGNQVVVSFYNNDISGAFRVIIEGMSRDGRLAHIEEIME
jgi:hypothetical protein